MKTIKTIVIALLASLTASQSICHEFMTSSPSPFVMHFTMLQELKARFNKILTAVPEPIIADTPLTQTEAYLKVYKKDVKRTFGEELKTHKKMIHTIIDKEREFANTHAVFYHAHDREFIVLHDFMKLLDEYLRIVTVHSDFIPLRLKDIHAINQHTNVQEYLNAYADIDDHDEETRRHMMCVNLSLFGNHNNWGECTFYYFLRNQSISTGLNKRLEPIFAHYGLQSKYIEELANLTAYLESSTGNLLQIFIPHDMVNSLLYLSRPQGIPCKRVVLDGKKYRCKEKSMQSLIEYMRASPDRITDLDEWQARLMFFDPLLDMHPQIKLFRYNTISDQNMKQYQEKLRSIVARIVVDYLKTTTVQCKAPLFRLYHYMLIQNGESILKYM